MSMKFDLSRRDIFHLLLLDIMFITILIERYFSPFILLSPRLGGLFNVTPFLWLFIGFLVFSLALFLILFYILVHKPSDNL